jgi:hypothetical protein
MRLSLMQATSTNTALPTRPPHPESRGRTAPYAQAETDSQVTLSLSVNSIAVWLIQRSLRNALGAAIDVSVCAVDYRRNRTRFLINTARSELAHVMGAVISTLPEAEFGPVRSAS